MRSRVLFLCAVVLLLELPPAEGNPASQPADVRFESPRHTNTVFQPAHYATLPDWQSRREWLRDQVRIAAGLIPDPPRPPLNPKIFGKLVREGYTVEKVYFQGAAGLYVTGNLYRPLNAKGRCPAVACPHGHWPGGRLQHDERGSVPARCITLARHGAVVMAYDMIGFNDAARTFKHGEKSFDTPETALWGVGHFQLQTLNSIRVIDFLQSLPDVDPQRIGATGASGGGTQTFILGAVDDRVAVDCPVNMISSTMQGGCVCENAPCLRIDTNNMEIAAVFAPRPRLMVSATGDWTRLTPTVEYPFVRSIYALYGASDRLENVHVDAPHNYNLQSRRAMYAFFGRWLLEKPAAKPIEEESIPVERAEDLLVFDEDNAPTDLPSPEQIVERGEQQMREQMEFLRPVDRMRMDHLTSTVRLWLEHAVGSRWPRLGETSGRTEILEKPGPTWEVQAERRRGGRRVREMGWTPRPRGSRGAETIVLCVDPDGVAGADRHQPLVDKLMGAGCQVVFLEPFGTGSHRRDPSATRPADQQRFFTTFNRTDAAEGVYDIVTSLQANAEAGLNPRSSGRVPRIRLVGFGRMGPLCILARAMVPERFARVHDLRAMADLNGLDTTDDAAYVEQLFIPHIRRFGGLPAVAAVAATGPLWLHNRGGNFDGSWLDQAAKVSQSDVRLDTHSADVETAVDWLSAP